MMTHLAQFSFYLWSYLLALRMHVFTCLLSFPSLHFIVCVELILAPFKRVLLPIFDWGLLALAVYGRLNWKVGQGHALSLQEFYQIHGKIIYDVVLGVFVYLFYPAKVKVSATWCTKTASLVFIQSFLHCFSVVPNCIQGLSHPCVLHSWHWRQKDY